MATATISAVAVKVRTDLGTAPDVGPPIKTVSAAGSDGALVYHRINPYFFRLSDTTDTVQVLFECEHVPSNSVEYAANGTPQSEKWTGTTKVDTTRTRRTVEAALHRPITITTAPAARVSRTIVCTFNAVKVYSNRTQEWVALPETSDDIPGCHLRFKLTP